MPRTTITIAALFALAAGPAIAQQTAPAPAPAPAPEAQQQAPSIQSITVIDVTELPAETQTQVESIAGQRSAEDMEKLRASLDASPQIKAALEEKGASSGNVIVASLTQTGALTLVTRMKGG